MMDESVSSLGFDNQVWVLRVVKHSTEEGYGVVMTAHFPDHVFQCEALVSLVTKEHQYLHGIASEVLTLDSLALTYGIRMAVFNTDHEGRQLRCVQSPDDPHPDL